MGVVLNASGSFVLAKKTLAEKARKALFKIKSSISGYNFSPKTCLNLFDALVKPICLYGSEIWGAEKHINPKKLDPIENIFEKFIDKQPAEKLDISFCKFILGLHSKACNMAVRGELGRFPTYIEIARNVFQYYKHLSSDLIVSKNVLLNSCLYESKSLDHENVFSWFTYVRQMSTLLGKDPLNVERSDIECRFSDHWSKSFVGRYKLGDEGKFTNLVKFKEKFHYEKYLDDIRNRKQRIVFSRLRLSCHKLKIETGRYQKPIVPRNQRVCEFCSKQDNYTNDTYIDDELHFLICCQKFYTQRKDLLEKIYSLFPSTKQLSEDNLFKFLMSSEGNLSVMISKFCLENLQV